MRKLNAHVPSPTGAVNAEPTSLTVTVDFLGSPHVFIFDVNFGGGYTMSVAGAWQSESYFEFGGSYVFLSDGGGSFLGFFIDIDPVAHTLVLADIDGYAGDFTGVTLEDISLSYVWT